MKIFDGLSTVVAFVLKHIHAGLSTFLPDASGWAWGLSIVFLTMTVRIALFPLFVKQIKSQRRMQELAPKVKELQAKHKGDRETLNTELMKLYKDHGTNPISGCLPLILQLPIFFALFRVMNEFRPRGDGNFKGKFGLSDKLIEQGANAKILGAPISAAFNSSSDLLRTLDGNPTTVKVVAAAMVVLMGGTTFFTQRQMMARNGAAVDPQQAQIQKIMLYVLPLSFAVFGFSFPIGVLLYWLTTNVWSMGQQAYVIKRMPPVVPGAGTAKPTAKDGGKGDNKGANKGAGKGAADAGKNGKKGADTSANNNVDTDANTDTNTNATATPTKASAPAAKVPAASRGATGSRKHKKRKGGRR